MPSDDNFYSLNLTVILYNPKDTFKFVTLIPYTHAGICNPINADWSSHPHFVYHYSSLLIHVPTELA